MVRISLVTMLALTACPTASPPPVETDADADADSDTDADSDSDSDTADTSTPEPLSPYTVTMGDCMLLWITTGLDESSRLHHAETAPDLDGDGARDLITSAAFGEDTRVQLRAGISGLPLITFEVAGQAHAKGIDDVDGDGTPEVLVWSRHAPPTAPGAPSSSDLANTFWSLGVYSGASGAQIWENVGDLGDENFAIGATHAGDHDHDGIADILTGHPYPAGSMPGNAAGSVRILSSASGALISETHGPIGASGFGSGHLADLGEDELAVMVSRFPSLATTTLVGITIGSSSETWSVEDSPEQFLQFGDIADLNGDGTPDLLATYRDQIVNGAQGVVHALDGQTGTSLWQRPSTIINGHYGVGMTATDDGDGDGVADVTAGVSHLLPSIPTSGLPGQFTVISGATGEVYAEVMHLVDSDTFSGFGGTLSSIGDPSGRGGAGVLVLDPSSGAVDPLGALSAWSCLP